MVEDLVDLEGISDRNFDGVGCAERIELERLLITFSLEIRQSKNINNTSSHTHHELTPHLPLGMEVVNRKPANPCGKPFVQPQLIPPVHGHQVAKPLMSQLMGNHVGDPVLELCVGFSFIVKNSGGSISDETPIFHGTHGELVNSKKIRLGERIVNTKDLGEVVDDLVGVFKGEFALVFETARRVDSDGQVFTIVFALGKCLDVFEIANCPSSELIDVLSVFKGHNTMLNRHSRMYS